MYAKILVATDLTEASRPALLTAIDLARRLSSALTVLHVTQPANDRAWFVAPSAAEKQLFADVAQREHDAAARILADLVREADTSGRERVAATTLVRSGAAAEVILSTAKEVGADVVVMGTHGRRGLPHLLLGSVAERVVRHAHCPVLTVRQARAAS